MGIQNICIICNKQINDLYFLIVGSKLSIHENCLKCFVCSNRLEMGQKCFFKNGKFLCAHHQQESVKNSCKTCNLKINSTDYVIRSTRNDLYHLNCFKCYKCSKQIESGTKYGILNENIYCSLHYYLTEESRVLQAPDFNNNVNSDHRYDQNFNLSTSSSSVDSSNSSPLSCSSTNINNTTKINTTKSQPLQNKNSFQSNLILNSKKKRIRTSFKHQQLRIMKAHFQINQNPDSKDLKELSERTGLQKRVLQVWFQNSRAKQRKSSGGSIGASILSFGKSSFNQEENCNNTNDTFEEYDECDEEDEENLNDFDDNFDLDDSNKSLSNDATSLNMNTNVNNYTEFQSNQFQSNHLIDLYHGF